MRKPPLAAADFRNAIYIDFEGVGKSKKGELRRPHLAGIFRPAAAGKSGAYQCIVFKEEWRPACNGVYQTACICHFDDFSAALADELEKGDKYLVHWSPYEEEVLKEFLHPVIGERVLPRLYNLRPVARRYLKRTNRLKAGETVRDRTLEEFTSLIYQKRKPFPPIDIGAAEACRRIDKACASHNRWKQFSSRQQQYVKDLVAYNKGDCRATWLIALRVGNFFD